YPSDGPEDHRRPRAEGGIHRQRRTGFAPAAYLTTRSDGCRLPTDCAHPTSDRLLEELDLRVTSAREQIAMLVEAQVGGPQRLHHQLLQFSDPSSFEVLGDEKQRPARLEHAPDLLEILLQARPVVVSLHRRDEIELVVRKRKVRHAGPADVD